MCCVVVVQETVELVCVVIPCVENVEVTDDILRDGYNVDVTAGFGMYTYMYCY